MVASWRDYITTKSLVQMEHGGVAGRWVREVWQEGGSGRCGRKVGQGGVAGWWVREVWQDGGSERCGRMVGQGGVAGRWVREYHMRNLVLFLW